MQSSAKEVNAQVTVHPYALAVPSSTSLVRRSIVEYTCTRGESLAFRSSWLPHTTSVALQRRFFVKRLMICEASAGGAFVIVKWLRFCKATVALLKEVNAQVPVHPYAFALPSRSSYARRLIVEYTWVRS